MAMNRKNTKGVYNEQFGLQVRLLSLAFRQLWRPTGMDRWPEELNDVSPTYVDQDTRVLKFLGAIDDNGLTEVGRQMEPFVADERFAVSPRLAKVVLQAAKMGCAR